MRNFLHSRDGGSKGAALIIVLAFVVLLTGLALAYFSRSTTDRDVAKSSYGNTSADLVAQSALDIVVADLQQEILNGSGSPSPTASPVTLFVPTSNANMVPMRNPTAAPGTTPAIANLLRRSLRSDPVLWPDPVAGPAVGSRASAVNSTSDVSANGRSVTLARWNLHYMVPKSNTADSGSDPITTGFNAPSYWAPDWVIVTRAGPVSFASWNSRLADPSPNNNNYGIGRYAYAVYDEGGLVDMNAAGYPSPTTILQYGRKGSLAFADLTGLPGLSATAVDNIVGWRNYASSQPTGTLNQPSSNLTFSANAANTYYNFILSDPNYIQLTNYFTSSALNYFTNSFLSLSQTVVNNRTDQALVARQELINLRSAASGDTVSFSNALQSLGTFSREALANVPQWSPASPDSINPNFQTLFVTSSFPRNDGTIANVGAPYLNKRFLLQRLNWLTYKGPSGTRTIPTSAPVLGNADYDMWLLTRPDVSSIRFGLTSAFLQQGTAANILKYFGLVWDATNERWTYTSPDGGSPTSISTVSSLTGRREPDFFELLRAGILDSSVGDSLPSNPALPITHQQSKMLHILTIGANLIAQTRADSYPVRIACNVGGTTMEAVGMPRLPCISSLAACPVGVTAKNGGFYWFLVPNLWDPFRDTWDLTETNAGNSGNGLLLTPGYLRPPVRITVKGTGAGNTATIDLGRAPVSQSGSVDPTTGTTFTTLTVPTSGPSSLNLTTGGGMGTAFGRDGLLEAKRLGASDISTVVPVLDPTTLPATSAQWNSIARPAGDLSTYRTDNFIVFTVQLAAGASITSGQNPVLILQPGFQVSMDYQSPNGQWYSYSFLQGNNETSTWISAPNLDLGTSFSAVGLASGGSKPTIVNSGTNTATLWTLAALAPAPMLAKADPRSIRYNSQIGVINLANPPLPWASAGILGSIWPSQYATPANMTTSVYPVPTPTATPIPGTLGDNTNAGNGANPYNEAIPTPTPTPGGQNVSFGDNWRPVMMNRPFRSVGEMAYAFRDQPFRTLSFSSNGSPDAGLLDLFTTNDYSPATTPVPTPTPTSTAPPAMRAGVISLNSRQAPALASVLTSTIRREDTARQAPGGTPLPQPFPLGATDATNVANTLISLTSPSPVKNRADLPTLIANTNPVGFDATVPKTQREAIARAFGETVQTRTWNLLIDMIAQSGHYQSNAASLANFVVDGEQHYWVHVAIDRFTGQVIDKWVEVVNE